MSTINDLEFEYYTRALAGEFGGSSYKLGDEMPNVIGSFDQDIETSKTQLFAIDDQDYLDYYDNDELKVVRVEGFYTDEDGNTNNLGVIFHRFSEGGVYAWEEIQRQISGTQLPPTAGKVGKILTASGETGEYAWTNAPLFSVEAATELSSATPTPYSALNIVPNSYCEVVDNGNGYTVLKVEGQKLELDLLRRTYSAVYTSFADFNSTLETPITLYDLGYNGNTDEQVRALNLQLISSNMIDDSILFMNEGTPSKVGAVTYNSLVVNRIASTRCYASCYSKTGSQFYTWSSSTDVATEWLKVVTTDQLVDYIGLDESDTFFTAQSKLISNVADAVSDNDAVNKKQLAPLATSVELEEGFENTVKPEGALTGFMHNANPPSDGYVVDHKITYYGPAPGDLSNPVASFPPANKGQYFFMHYAPGDRLGMMFWHEDAVSDMFGIDVSSEESVAIQLDSVKNVLGQSNKTADTSKYIWNLEGRGVAPGTDVNNITATSDYVDADGNSVDSRSEAVSGIYSSGTTVQNGSILATRGGYCFDAATKRSIFVADTNSEYFVLRDVSVGGGTFNDVKVFSVFQYGFEGIAGSVVKYYDSYSSILGAELQTMRDTTEALDVRVYDLEHPENTDLDERVSLVESGAEINSDIVAIAQEADANGLVESILMSKSIKTSFSLDQSQTLSKKVGYNFDLVNEIEIDALAVSTDKTKWSRIEGVIRQVGSDIERVLKLRTGNHDFEIQFAVSKGPDSSVNVELSNANEDCNVTIIGGVVS